MIRFFVLGVCLLFVQNAASQDVLRISRTEAETMFLANNLLLMAEELNIERQKAEVIQAKLWPNPEFSISEANLWENPSVEPSPPFWGEFGRNQQISFELNQLVHTAGKRKKRIALEEVEVAMAERYFEALLGRLKFELRTRMTELQFVQLSISVHSELQDRLSTLIHAHQNQLEHGNISRAEFIRLKAQELEINKVIRDLNLSSIEIQKELKQLLRTAPTLTLELTNDGFVIDPQNLKTPPLEALHDSAKTRRPDYQLALLEQRYSNHLLAYEKAMRVPDLTFGVNYDRNGSTMLDFVGFGVSFDLPVFNRNRGNIQKAMIDKESAALRAEHMAQTVENEVVLLRLSLLQATAFLEGMEEDYESELDGLLENYTRNFTARNIDIVEYFDFMDAYLENKKIILEARKDVNHLAEELNYALGMPL